MRYIQNAYYRFAEFFTRIMGDSFSADYYAAKREENK